MFSSPTKRVEFPCMLSIVRVTGCTTTCKQADFWYRAKVVREKDGQVLLHYLGWNTRHDEWMSRDAHRIAAVKYLESEENAAAASAAAASVSTHHGV